MGFAGQVRQTRFEADGKYLGPMKMIRRALMALGIAGFVAAVMRLRGTGGSPPQQGGWRELSDADLA